MGPVTVAGEESSLERRLEQHAPYRNHLSSCSRTPFGLRKSADTVSAGADIFTFDVTVCISGRLRPEGRFRRARFLARAADFGRACSF
jgi:hypothetical protein